MTCCCDAIGEPTCPVHDMGSILCLCGEKISAPKLAIRGSNEFYCPHCKTLFIAFKDGKPLWKAVREQEDASEWPYITQCLPERSFNEWFQKVQTKNPCPKP